MLASTVISWVTVVTDPLVNFTSTPSLVVLKEGFEPYGTHQNAYGAVMPLGGGGTCDLLAFESRAVYVHFNCACHFYSASDCAENSLTAHAAGPLVGDFRGTGTSNVKCQPKSWGPILDGNWGAIYDGI
jgi:hypothetical protein